MRDVLNPRGNQTERSQKRLQRPSLEEGYCRTVEGEEEGKRTETRERTRVWMTPAKQKKVQHAQREKRMQRKR